MSVIHVRTPLDLVVVLPYQLGYRLNDCLVLVGLRRRHLGLVQRVDLPTGPAQDRVVAARMLDHVRRDGCTAAVVIVYESQVGTGAQAGGLLADSLRSAGLEVSELMVVRDGRVYFPERPDRVERELGIALPSDDAVPAVADFVAFGRRPSADRGALAARVSLEPGPLADRVAHAVARLDPFDGGNTLQRRAIDDWGRLLDPATPAAAAPASAASAARLAVSLTDRHLRDLLCAWLCPGTLDVDAFDPQLVERARARWPQPDVATALGPGWAPATSGLLVERLCWLARQLPDGHAAGVLAVLASLTWWLGDGALTRVALDRALAAAPDYRLACLLEHLLDLAIRPGQSGRSA
ncbi:MAG: DUF4192 domain-containing protein [Dermatophilaceae bacterium]